MMKLRHLLRFRVLLVAVLMAGLTSCTKQDQPEAAKPAEPRAEARASEPQSSTYDVVVYGATPAGIMAAVAAARQGEKVVVLESSYLIGGMMSGGLTKTDMGRTDAIGGFAREFYDRVLAFYTKTYGADSTQVFECNHGYYFESKLALQIFKEMLDEAHVTVATKEQLEEVNFKGAKISSIRTQNYETRQESLWNGKIFIDATYEGDLIAKAHCLYRLGREGRTEFNEPAAGLTEGPEQYRGLSDHRGMTYNIRGGITDRPDLRLPFPKPTHYYRDMVDGLIDTVKKKDLHKLRDLFPNMDRYGKINGHYDTNSGDCPGVNYTYIEADYDERAVVAQRIRDHWLSIWWGLQNDPELPEDFRQDAMSIGVARDEYTESNNVSPQIYVRVGRRLLGDYFMTQDDLIDNRFKPDTVCLGNYGFDSHKVQTIRTPTGLKPEGEISGSTDLFAIPYRCMTYYGIPNLLDPVSVSASAVAYTALRMEPVFMMLGEAAGEAAHLAIKNDVAVQKISIPALQEELKKAKVPLEPFYRPVVDIKVLTPGPYKPGQPIKFKLVPKDVRVPLKTIAWNFDGTGAVQGKTEEVTYTFPLARKARVALQVVDQNGVKANTRNLDLVIGENPVPDIEEARAKTKGPWYGERGAQMDYYYQMGKVNMPGVGDEPVNAANAPKLPPDGESQAVFTLQIPKTGRYKVAFAFPSTPSAASNTPVTIRHAGGEEKKIVNQKETPPFAFVPLGEYRFEEGKPAVITVSNTGVDGRIAIDTVRLIWVGE